MGMEKAARDRLIEACKYHGTGWKWVYEANVYNDEGVLYIQTEGTDATFPRGKWESIESILEVL